MAILKSVRDSNFDSHFERAAPAQSAVLRIGISVTLVPLDPESAWAKQKHSAALPGAGPTTLPPGRVVTKASDVKTSNVMDANGNLYPCKTWLDSDWTAFTKRFKYIVEQGWNNQMIFLPIELGLPGSSLSDDDFEQLIGNPKAPAHIRGTLEVDLQTGVGSQAIIEVAQQVNPTAPFRHKMTRISDQSVQLSAHKFSSTARNIKGASNQFAASHEVGHWLRAPGQRLLNHIDRADALKLPTAQQNAAQYGLTLGRFQTMMGGGNVVDDWAAAPWRNRLGVHTSLEWFWLHVHRLKFNWTSDDVSEHQKRILSRRGV